jgi:hypothetical protein
VPADEILSLVADVLGRPAGELAELDRRSVRLAFLPGDFLTVTVRDLRSQEVLEPTIDLRAEVAVDPAALRSQDRAEAATRPLAPRVRDLLLRHPDLGRIEAILVRSGGRIEHWIGDATGLVSRSADPDVVLIDLAADPEILDTGTET